MLKVLDAYWPCCGLQFRDRKLLIDHMMCDPVEHIEQITKIVHNHSRIIAILKQDKTINQMRARLDKGEMDWWNETKNSGEKQ